MAARKELEEKERARAREVWERDRQRLARRQREQEEREAKERTRAQEVWKQSRQRLARRQREQEERQAKADKRAAHLGRDGAARLERMMAFRRAKGLGGSSRVPPPRRGTQGTQGTREEPRRLQERERDLDEEKNVCIEGREVLAGMTRGVG